MIQCLSEGESLCIGDDRDIDNFVEVKVLKISKSGKKVKLGVKLPRSMPIFTGEVWALWQKAEKQNETGTGENP